ncbi:FMN-dependent NADH-azoreductase [Spiribacter halobius]|uniref:FMN dependent NADH:quinone oxidoreductase n=1 Tax=Sediminicurvatus halobius TaxID=2182432 RepID=A0A2U2MXY4_9GAMM|nr:NAD(P)H-dependent oxidoreductase [Spiribacter halobius]PWG61806.1 FMN-dependent NADH-azoreductase [Spiribacter halobius]UEX77645.1 NAD(P)H-dependent oxidoreductase [Spiribacter halobius]
MDRILHIDASARKTRSLSRDLSAHFVSELRLARPEVEVVYRDVGTNPPPFVTEAWIAAAFTDPSQRNTEQQAALRTSDELIDELESVDGIVIGTPMYNYGMPAALKAWFDQVIRVNRTFSFDLARGDWPLAPILSGKKLAVLTARGEFGFEPGGIRSDWNHLETHIRTVSHYLGVDEMTVISIDYQEFGDERHRQSVASAFSDASRLARTWAAPVKEDAV